MPIGNKDQNMDETLETQRTIKLSHQPKSFGLPGPLTGALIGISLFNIAYFASNAVGLEILPTALMIPGYLTGSTIGSVSTSDVLDQIIFFGISAIPPAVLGALFGSKNKGLIIMGIVLFIMYCLVSAILGFGLYLIFAADY